MYSYQFRLKQDRKIPKSIKKIGLVLIMAFLSLNISKIPGTNAFFLEKDKLGEVSVSAGYWIPKLEMKINPASLREDSRYIEPPCVKFSSDIEKTTIYYSFQADNIIDGTVPQNECLYPPQGESTLTAWAINDDNDKWVSETIYQDFKVGQEIKSGDVIINEVMWMGSKGNAKDQWVELKNVSGKDLHFKDFYLTYKKSSNNEVKLARITNNKVVKDGEYFLLAKYNKHNSDMDVQRDNNEPNSDDDMENFEYGKFQIKLYTNDSKEMLIDTAGNGTQEPKEGNRDHFYPMERKNTPANGADYDNWYTCEDASSTSLYWDDGRNERGTPGHKNLSKNDHTYSDYDPSFKESITKIGETIVNVIVEIITPDKTEEPTDDKSKLEEETEVETETPFEPVPEVTTEEPALETEIKEEIKETEEEKIEEVKEVEETKEPAKEPIAEVKEEEPALEAETVAEGN